MQTGQLLDDLWDIDIDINTLKFNATEIDIIKKQFLPDFK